MTTYASKTTVSSENTRLEIERTLRRYGADDFGYATSAGVAMIAFTAKDRQIRFTLQLPDRNAREFTHTPATRQKRTAPAAEREYEQALRQRWRALLLLVKAKLEAVESGIVTFEQEFLAQTVLPSNRTVFEETSAPISTMYLTGQVRPLFSITA